MTPDDLNLDIKNQETISRCHERSLIPQPEIDAARWAWLTFGRPIFDDDPYREERP